MNYLDKRGVQHHADRGAEGAGGQVVAELGADGAVGAVLASHLAPDAAERWEFERGSGEVRYGGGEAEVIGERQRGGFGNGGRPNTRNGT